MADLLALLEEISAESPCGDHLEYDPAYLELEKNIQGTPEDPITGESAQPPNWRDIQNKSLAILQKSKDLQVAVYLLRALINTEGLLGFRDGLTILSGLLERYWDHVHPQLDPDDSLDPTARMNILEELNSFESVLRPLNLANLVDSKSAGRFCLRDIHIATDKIEAPQGANKPDLNVVKGSFIDAPQDALQATYQAINESISMIQQMEHFVSEQVGMGNGASFAEVLSLLKEMRHVFDQFAVALLTESGAQSAETEPSIEYNPAQPVQKQISVGAINNRQDVIKTLDLICKYYAEVEPTSPVPILLNRAKYLVTSDFMQIVQNLLPDGLSQLEQIKGPETN